MSSIRFAFLAFLFSFTSLATAQVRITANAPYYNFEVLPGSFRQINVNITGGTQNTVNWSVASTTGGAFATFTTPSASALPSLSAALPTAQVNISGSAGTCSISGSIGSYTVTSTATVTVQAQSVDDASKSTTFLFNVCAKTTTVMVAPAYQQAFQSQHRTLQSWVSGNNDETGTWSIISQPSGGDGLLADNQNRDADFIASVTGRYALRYTSNDDPAQSATAIVYVSPNPMPAYASTANGTEPHECYVDPAFTGGDYEVGTGKRYSTIQSTPAANLINPGSIIRIWNTDTTGSNPSVFHEYYQIASSGTPTQPIMVCGVPDAGGNLPIVDGANATGQPGVSAWAAAGYGVITTWAGGYGNSSPYGYWQGGTAGPSYVSVSGLHIRNATPSLTYTPPSGGAAQPYVDGASCLNIRSGSYVDLSGNDLDACTNGLFTGENANSGWAPVTQDVTVMGNHIHNSGWGSEFGDHQVYFQSFYGLLQGNRIDDYSSTALGTNVKWRGVEGIFRYNYLGINSAGTGYGYGPTREFDLVDIQDAAPYVTFEGYLQPAGTTNCAQSMYCLGDAAGANIIAAYQESAQKDFVYGNIIKNVGSALNMIHYAQDHDDGMADRDGTLYFYGNTMDTAVAFDTGDGEGYMPIYQARIDARNNIFWNNSAYGIAFNSISSIILSTTTNLMATGSFAISTPIAGGNYSAMNANGWQSACNYTCPWPSTNPINAHVYGLTNANYLATSVQPYDPTSYMPTAGSAAIKAGTPLSGVISTMPVRYEFSLVDGSLKHRYDPLTIGATEEAVTLQAAVTPSFSVAAGTYSSAETVAITSTSPLAAIYYTVDGTTPTTSSTVYSGPITVAASETIKAIASGAGLTASSVATAAYTINAQVPSPVFSLASGTYTSSQIVSISAAVSTPAALSSRNTVGASVSSYTIYYTADGSTPNTSSLVYTGPVTVSSTTTLQAITVANGYAASVPASATYTITQLPAAQPLFNVPGGTYSSPQTVAISTTTPSAVIYYTTNGITPTTNSSVYSGPLTVASTETISAITVASGFKTSTAASATYTISMPAAAPSFSVASGSYSSIQTVSIGSSTPGATIYYTTTGVAPTTDSTVYIGPITVASSETVSAIAVASGYTTSAAASATYTISIPAPSPTFSLATGTYTSPQTLIISASQPSTASATASFAPAVPGMTSPVARIYYTTDGSTPTPHSTVYTGPITVSATETIQAITVAGGYAVSAPAVATFTIIKATAAKPTFSVAGGTYNAVQTVAIASATPAGIIYFTTDGSMPTSNSAVYSGPITVSVSETITAIVSATNYNNSSPAADTYVIKIPAAAKPTFSVVSGTYTSAQAVVISSSTASVTIYYTTDGSTPTTSSAIYSGAISVVRTETLKAMAAGDGHPASAVSSAAYTIKIPVVSAPTFSLAPGAYKSTQTVSLKTATPEALIHYTTDGSTPTVDSAVYSTPLTIIGSETLKAIAMESGFTASPVALAAYTILQPAAAPTFSVHRGIYTTAQTVTITSETPSATIYYTRHGSVPTTNSPRYDGPITVAASEEIEAIAVAPGYTASPAASQTYFIVSPELSSVRHLTSKGN